MSKPAFNIFLRVFKGFIIAFLLHLPQSCIESFTPATETFEDILSVSATITDELKIQEIFLSRSFRFEDENSIPARNADVEVVDETRQVFSFSETDPGRYRSDQTFRAIAGMRYQLNIALSSGEKFSSESVITPQPSKLDAIHAKRITNAFGQNGMGIFANSFDLNGASRFYRYEYEETYKIIAPRWNPFALIPGEGCEVTLGARMTEERICYNTDLSRSIIVTKTDGLSEDRVSDFMVRFIRSDNYIISHRYSILVRQFVQTLEANSFYTSLKEFSESESPFSENQLGFLNGNISPTNTQGTKVFGLFEVCSVSEKRIFFNYDNFYPDEALPPFADPCSRSAPPLTNRVGACVLKPLVEANLIRFDTENDNIFPMEGPFVVVSRVCGDCTALGETEIPEFWIE